MIRGVGTWCVGKGERANSGLFLKHSFTFWTSPTPLLIVNISTNINNGNKHPSNRWTQNVWLLTIFQNTNNKATCEWGTACPFGLPDSGELRWETVRLGDINQFYNLENKWWRRILYKPLFFYFFFIEFRGGRGSLPRLYGSCKDIPAINIWFPSLWIYSRVNKLCLTSGKSEFFSAYSCFLINKTGRNIELHRP